MVNVLVAGITGCKKETAISSVISQFETAHSSSRGYAGQVNVEDVLQKTAGIKWGLFLESLNFTGQEMYARMILDEAISRLGEYKHRFLNLHLTLYHNNRFFAPFPFDRIKEFRPDVIVTLIEDVYAAWARVKMKSDTLEDPVKTRFTLSEMISWRSVEIMMADFLAKTLNIRNYVVAVKHPPSMLYSLVFHPEKLIVYVAHPISRFRRGTVDEREKLEKERKQLLNFVGELQKRFIVFSPTTIDERILVDLKAPLQQGVHWELPPEQMVREDDLRFPLELGQQEVDSVAYSIDPNIKFRDFRLVSDVDCVVAYRPYWDKDVHEGVKSEIDQAQNLMIETVHYFPEGDGDIAHSPFKGQASAAFKEEAEVLTNLERRKPRLERRWGI